MSKEGRSLHVVLDSGCSDEDVKAIGAAIQRLKGVRAVALETHTSIFGKLCPHCSKPPMNCDCMPEKQDWPPMGRKLPPAPPRPPRPPECE